MQTSPEAERPATELVVVVDETITTGNAVNAAAVLGPAVGARHRVTALTKRFPLL